jgi:hypothetical protein
VTETPDDRVDLSPLEPDATHRVTRIITDVSGRVVAARRAQTQRTELWHGVRRRLARLALPAALAAAASITAVRFTGRHSSPRPERFAAVVLERGPARPWIVLDRRPEIPELVAVLERTP